MRDTHGELLDAIREEQRLSDENEEKLGEATEDFNSNYDPEQTSLVDVSLGGDEEHDESEENGEEEGS
jgi:hypothetical protein